MKSFYSILYIKPEPASDEKVAVGLLLNANKKPVFDYSNEKLKIAANLVGAETTDSLERKLKNIKKKITLISETENQIEAFDINPFSESYFKYLNNYSNNLLVYSNPSENHGDFSVDDFIDLFRLLIDKNFEIEDKEEESFKSIVKNRINSSVVKEKMDIFYKVPKKSVKSIYRDHTVDYIGVNGSIISGNSIDMKGDPYSLENKFYLLRVLVNGLTDLAKRLEIENSGKHIVYYNEPEGKKNNDLLRDALDDKSSPLELKPWEEFEYDEEWIANTPIKKFSEMI